MKQVSTTINMVRLSIVQGIFYMATGLWAILDMDSFMAVTGPKEDIWLVRTVGMLVFFVGGGLLAAGLRKQVTLPIIIIAAGAALGFTVVDITYVWLNVISPVYLLDAVAEILILALWVILIFKRDTADEFSPTDDQNGDPSTL
ncbi:MAG: hypothetical protein WD059_05730 [Balneolaceae bacterium]